MIAALRRLAHLLVSPSPAVMSEADRRLARLLATMSFLNVPLALLVAGTPSLFLPRTEARGLQILVTVHAGVAAVAYAMARTKRLQTSLALSLGLQWLVPFAALFVLENEMAARAFGTTAWMSPLLIFTVATASLRVTFWVVAACLLVPISAKLAHRYGSPDDLPQSIALALCTGIYALVLNRHRNRVEQDRQAELVARNEELAGLGQRLTAKSTELARSNLALDKAYHELQRKQQSLVLSEKMASLGRLTAGIAHEMGSPLAAVRTALAEAAQLTEEYDRSIGDREVNDEDHRAIAKELAASLRLAAKAAERAASFVRDIKDRTRDVGSHETRPFDAVAAIEDVVQMLRSQAVRAKCHVEFEHRQSTIPALGFPGKVGQVATNLLSNALDACAERGGGEVRVDLVRDGAELMLTVEDDGPGIPEENLSHIFEPLFTTKPVGQGTGLGLTIVHDIVAGDLHGSIDVSNVPGHGARFVVRFPVSAP